MKPHREGKSKEPSFRTTESQTSKTSNLKKVPGGGAQKKRMERTELEGEDLLLQVFWIKHREFRVKRYRSPTAGTEGGRKRER